MSSDRLLRILVPVLLLSSCSVKENRAKCPCALTLELTGLPVRPVVLGVAGEGYAVTEVVHADTVLVLPVPKGELTVSAVGGALAEGDGSVRIPEGEEAPPLYLFHTSVSTSDEQLVLPVTLHKQYCILELLFKGPPGYGPPFEVAVEGFYGGWQPDGSAAPGPFSRRLLPGSDGRATLRLPRQGDDSLLMHIVFSDQVVRTFALGSYIAASGYDWTAPDLDDLTLHVDISLTSVTLSTDLWSSTEEIELFI
jgi:hypothetical protein